jgi:hypothetical protein
VCVAGLPFSYDKPVVVHEGEPPAPVHTAATKLWMAALLHKEVQFCCLEELVCWVTSRDDQWSLISCFRHDVDGICALLVYYTASCGNCLPTFWDNVSVPSSRVKSPLTIMLSQNVGKQLPHAAA